MKQKRGLKKFAGKVSDLFMIAGCVLFILFLALTGETEVVNTNITDYE